MKHLQLIEEAKEAIAKVFGDTTVAKSTTKESLEELVEYVEECINAISDDLE